MGDGIRPKGRKSFAATRSEEAAEAYRKDRQPERKCPNCGSEETDEYYGQGLYRCRVCAAWFHGGHEEKVKE